MADNATKRYFGGVDIGSTTSKAVIIDEEGSVLGFQIIDTEQNRNLSGQKVMKLALAEAGLEHDVLTMIYSTGYGRRSYEQSDKAVPEIICHAVGTAHLYPGVRTIVDIGGQDAKIITLDQHGNIVKFEMNDKCAAGTGRFFEVLSRRLLNVDIDELAPIALRSENPCQISSTCTVFAESEVVSYLSQGVSQEDIAMGILESIARRIYSMGNAMQMRFEEPIVATGGPAKNIALKKAFEKRFGKPVTLAEIPQMEAALGAALMAKKAFDLGEA